ncbi:MAG: hypothetical protein K6F05_06155 [Succinivibrio sp.]|nr:hypothetical protein [Succinivibrio sp.]
MKKNVWISIIQKSFKKGLLSLLAALTALSASASEAGRYEPACEELAQALRARLPDFNLPFEFTPSSMLTQEMTAALEKYRFEVCKGSDCAGERLEVRKLQGTGLTVLCLRTLNLTLSRGYILRQHRLKPHTALSVGLDE